jgi:hypothetical protein
MDKEGVRRIIAKLDGGSAFGRRVDGEASRDMNARHFWMERGQARSPYGQSSKYDRSVLHELTMGLPAGLPRTRMSRDQKLNRKLYQCGCLSRDTEPHDAKVNRARYKFERVEKKADLRGYEREGRGPRRIMLSEISERISVELQ